MYARRKLSQECILCNDVITHPICFRCIEHEVEDWLADKAYKLMPKLKKTGKLFESYMHPVTNCLLCGENMNVCSHCYVYEVRKMLEDYPRMEEEFTDFFNFELRGSGQCLSRIETVTP